MTSEERELLRLLALKARWPDNGGREEFGVAVKLDRAIDKAMDAAFRPALVMKPVPEGE